MPLLLEIRSVNFFRTSEAFIEEIYVISDCCSGWHLGRKAMRITRIERILRIAPSGATAPRAGAGIFVNSAWDAVSTGRSSLTK